MAVLPCQNLRLYFRRKDDEGTGGITESTMGTEIGKQELYYQLRDAIGDIRKYASDKLGCQVTENALMVKMEKIPVIPENFMGILDFSSKEEYACLCILLMFLEEKDTQEQFILSQLTEYISANMP